MAIIAVTYVYGGDPQALTEHTSNPLRMSAQGWSAPGGSWTEALTARASPGGGRSGGRGKDRDSRSACR
jgi:hypothetical protein